MESFGRLGEESSTFIDQLAASVVGGRDGGSMATKEAVKERLQQIVSVGTQVAISRRVSRFKLQLRDHQEARRSRGGMADPHLCRRDGAWMRHRIQKNINDRSITQLAKMSFDKIFDLTAGEYLLL